MLQIRSCLSLAFWKAFQIFIHFKCSTLKGKNISDCYLSNIMCSLVLVQTPSSKLSNGQGSIRFPSRRVLYSCSILKRLKVWVPSILKGWRWWFGEETQALLQQVNADKYGWGLGTGTQRGWTGKSVEGVETNFSNQESSHCWVSLK